MTEHTDETPSDIVEAFHSQQISRDQMVDKLRDYPYTWGTFIGEDGYEPGTFDELIYIRLEGDLLSDEEFTEILAKQDY